MQHAQRNVLSSSHGICCNSAQQWRRVVADGLETNHVDDATLP